MNETTIHFDVGWIDEYVENLKPYIHVREADSLLIKIPNEAYKLDAQGLKVLSFLLKGGSVRAIVAGYKDQEKVARDLHAFFCDLKALLKGCYHEGQQRRALEKIEFALPFNTLPVLSEIALTYKCNLACRFCYAACGCTKKASGTELTTDEWKGVLRTIRKGAEVPSVSFTGGEPSLRDDLPELVRCAKELKMWTNLISNGTMLTPALAKTLKAAGLDSAQISIEGASAEVHDPIAGRPKAFERSIAGLKNIRDAGIRVHTNTTISALNKDVLLPILDLVKDLGFDKFSMNMLMPAGTAIENLKETFISYTEIGPIVLAVKEKAEQLGLEFMWYSPTPMCVFNPVVHGLGNKGCAACDGLLSVAPNGDVLPCSSYPEPVGNMLKSAKDFPTMWHGPRFKFFQEKRFAHKICQACDKLAICNGGCPLYWEKAGYEEILQKQEVAYADCAPA